MPFVWSDQYKDRIQILGRGRGDDPVEVVLGSTQERKFVALYHHDGIVSAALGLNLPKPLMAYRALRHYSRRDMTFRFVSNVDGTDFAEATRDLDPEETLFVVCSMMCAVHPITRLTANVGVKSVRARPIASRTIDA